MDVRRVLEYALQREHEGLRFFEANAERMTHAAAAGVFRRLAEEEQKHIAFIESQLRALSGDHTGAAPELEDWGAFAARARSEMLDQTTAESMVPDLPVLRMAYLIERDLSEFYEMAATRAEGEAREALAMLAEWEREHERLFKEIHDRLFEQYAHMPWGG